MPYFLSADPHEDEVLDAEECDECGLPLDECECDGLEDEPDED
jgi:hypothetical protein